MAEKSGHKFIERGAHKGKGIAVFTSGGDSQVNNNSVFLSRYALLHCFLGISGYECGGSCYSSYGNIFGL